MLYIVVCACFTVCVFGAPAPTDVVPLEKQQPTVIPIVSQSDELEPNGTYHFSYETGNGIKRDEISYDKVVPKARSHSPDSNEGGEDSDGDSDEIHVQMGSYSYTAPDGTLISVRYIADENGFQPIGDHIPRVPSAPGKSSNEKSGRALKASDNAESASAPAVAAKSVEKPESKSAAAASGPKSEGSAEVISSTTPAGKEEEASTKGADAETSTTEAPKPAEETSTTEISSTEASTTEASKPSETPEVPTEASTTEAAKTTESSTTPATDASTTANDATSLASEQSTTNAEPSTTEAASPTTAAA